MATEQNDAGIKALALRAAEDAYIGKLERKHEEELQIITSKHAKEMSSLKTKHEEATSAVQEDLRSVSKVAAEVRDAAMSRLAYQVRKERAIQAADLREKIERLKERATSDQGAGNKGADELKSSASATNPSFAVPMTELQRTLLLQKIKKVMKTMYAVVFLEPVNTVAYNIPSYLRIVKRPMDLGTMKKRLKDFRYATVQEFISDFELIVSNSRLFNGDSHYVTDSALEMKAYFDRMMKVFPDADGVVETKKRGPVREEASEKPSKITKQQ